MTRTAKRQGTKSKNYKQDPKNIWHKKKIKVGRNPDRIPTRIKRMANSQPGFRFIHLMDKYNLSTGRIPGSSVNYPGY